MNSQTNTKNARPNKKTSESAGNISAMTQNLILSHALILTVTSPIVINVPTRGLLAVETKDSFVL